MNLQDISALIKLREFLYLQVNGLTGMKKEKVKPVQQVITKIDNAVVEAALKLDVENVGQERFAIARSSSIEDFQKSMEMVAAAVGSVGVDDKGIVTVTAPDGPIKAPALKAESAPTDKAIKTKAPKPTKKRVALRRSDGDDITPPSAVEDDPFELRDDSQDE